MTPARVKNICFSSIHCHTERTFRGDGCQTYNIFSGYSASANVELPRSPSGAEGENEQSVMADYFIGEKIKIYRKAGVTLSRDKNKKIFFKSRETEPCFISKGCFPESLFLLEVNDE